MLKLTDDDFNRLVDYMKKNYGINLEKKRVLIEGRLSNTITQRGFKSFKEFIDFAFADKTGNETMQLVNKLTTNHTFFMREPEHFEYLKTTLLPYFEQQNKDRSLNVWCAASSTGQEPYTLAMTIDEYFGTKGAAWNWKILATDLDTDVLRKAEAGIYTIDMLKDVPKTWMTKYFVKQPDGSFQVIDRIRKQITYKQFNLMDRISAPRPYDLISCRNVMIYFEQDTKNALIERFYDVTKEGGYLYIGHAESVGKNTRYTYVKPAIYKKSSDKPAGATSYAGRVTTPSASASPIAAKPAAPAPSISKPAGTSAFAAKPAAPAPSINKPAGTSAFAAKPAASAPSINKPAGTSAFAAKPAAPASSINKPAGTSSFASKPPASSITKK